MWRVHKVLQFKRRQIKMQHVALPMLILMLSAMVVLTVWTVLDPLTWVRVEVDNITLESIGECTSDHYGAFVAPLAVLIVISMGVTGYFAWKTKDVDNAYTESRWIFILFLVQLEVIVIATPIVVLLIILPKYTAYRRAIRGVDKEVQLKRGQYVYFS